MEHLPEQLAAIRDLAGEHRSPAGQPFAHLTLYRASIEPWGLLGVRRGDRVLEFVLARLSGLQRADRARPCRRRVAMASVNRPISTLDRGELGAQPIA